MGKEEKKQNSKLQKTVRNNNKVSGRNRGNRKQYENGHRVRREREMRGCNVMKNREEEEKEGK